MKFFTKYNLPERKLREYDSLDHVDRLSYCDSTTQIQRFIQAGENLRNNRFNTMYSVNDVLQDDDSPAVDVYTSDPVETSMKVSVLKETLGSRISEKIKRNAARNDKAKKVTNEPKNEAAAPVDPDNAT